MNSQLRYRFFLPLLLSMALLVTSFSVFAEVTEGLLEGDEIVDVINDCGTLYVQLRDRSGRYKLVRAVIFPKYGISTGLPFPAPQNIAIQGGDQASLDAINALRPDTRLWRVVQSCPAEGCKPPGGFYGTTDPFDLAKYAQACDLPNPQFDVIVQRLAGDPSRTRWITRPPQICIPKGYTGPIPTSFQAPRGYPPEYCVNELNANFDGHCTFATSSCSKWSTLERLSGYRAEDLAKMGYTCRQTALADCPPATLGWNCPRAVATGRPAAVGGLAGRVAGRPGPIVVSPPAAASSTGFTLGKVGRVLCGAGDVAGVVAACFNYSSIVSDEYERNCENPERCLIGPYVDAELTGALVFCDDLVSAGSRGMKPQVFAPAVQRWNDIDSFVEVRYCGELYHYNLSDHCLYNPCGGRECWWSFNPTTYDLIPGKDGKRPTVTPKAEPEIPTTQSAVP